MPEISFSYTYSREVQAMLDHARHNVRVLDRAGLGGDARALSCLGVLERQFRHAFRFERGAAGMVLHLDHEGADAMLAALAQLSALARECEGNLNRENGQ